MSSRVPQSGRPNVLSPQATHRRQQTQAYTEQSTQQAPPDYYFEEPMLQEYVGDYLDSSSLGYLESGLPPPPPPPQTTFYRQHVIPDGNGGLRTVDLYPRKIYYPIPQAHYYYDPRLAAPPQIQNQQSVTLPPSTAGSATPATITPGSTNVLPQRQPSATMPLPPAHQMYRKRILLPQAPLAPPRAVNAPQASTGPQFLTDEELNYREHMLLRQRQMELQQMHMHQQQQQQQKGRPTMPFMPQQYARTKFNPMHAPQVSRAPPPPAQQAMDNQPHSKELYSTSRSKTRVATVLRRIKRKENHSKRDLHGGDSMGDSSEERDTMSRKDVSISTQSYGRRHPVTVRTARFIRRPINSSLYKRPSALCLPLAVQPDPTLLARKPRRSQVSTDVMHPEEGVQDEMTCNSMFMSDTSDLHEHNEENHHQQEQQRPKRSSNDMAMTEGQLLLDDSEEKGDMLNKSKPTMHNEHTVGVASTADTKARLDAILQRYDRIFRNTTKDGKVDFNATGDAPAHLRLKPRLPPCLKEKEEAKKTEKMHDEKVAVEKGTAPIIEETSNMLDELLTELTEHGFNDTGTTLEEQRKLIEKKKPDKKLDSKLQSLASEVMPSCSGNNDQERSTKEATMSYNYAEIKDTMSKSKLESKESSTQSLIKDGKIDRKHEVLLASSDRELTAEESAELHRTKSYVVNLIDTALSNHFRTSYGPLKQTNKEKLDAASAVEMLKKQSQSSSTTTSTSNNKQQRKMNKELAEMYASSCVSQSSCQSSVVGKGDMDTSCKERPTFGPASTASTREEPLFVKQLRQMRWGHLKHIQQEVRRLEELERFLDSCNMSTFEKYTYQ